MIVFFFLLNIWFALKDSWRQLNLLFIFARLLVSSLDHIDVIPMSSPFVWEMGNDGYYLSERPSCCHYGSTCLYCLGIIGAHKLHIGVKQTYFVKLGIDWLVIDFYYVFVTWILSRWKSEIVIIDQDLFFVIFQELCLICWWMVMIWLSWKKLNGTLTSK